MFSVPLKVTFAPVTSVPKATFDPAAPLNIKFPLAAVNELDVSPAVKEGEVVNVEPPENVVAPCMV